ncbi:m-AAA protease-interacting protein 1, mitochondrial [Chelonus insularis]|uniref:m-AAA protease-interacting protein 1, mitochondrial n=1 Tax=Chelonus insularis TaxID=460826 RepID=UPI00158D19C3|nr:m-AAA protease-interacting protein 1, mitochondrial [Chelonus insularis]
MVFINVYKHLCRSKITYLTRIIKNKGNWLKNVQSYQEQKLIRTPINIYYTSKRFLSSGFKFDINPDSSEVQLPPLTDDKPLIFQNFFSLFSNPYYLSILSTFYDREFSAEEFFEGSKQALEVVSKAIAVEDFNSLEELVADNVISKIRQSITKLSEAQKQLIPVLKEDILYFIPAKIRINKQNIQEKNVVSAEITMIYYSYRREQDGIKRVEVTNPKSAEQIIISNCRFRREYTDNIPSSWIITMYNQFTIIGLQPPSSQ